MSSERENPYNTSPVPQISPPGPTSLHPDANETVKVIKEIFDLPSDVIFTAYLPGKSGFNLL
jgi:hypothetical protein